MHNNNFFTDQIARLESFSTKLKPYHDNLKAQLSEKTKTVSICEKIDASKVIALGGYSCNWKVQSICEDAKRVIEIESAFAKHLLKMDDCSKMAHSGIDFLSCSYSASLMTSQMIVTYNSLTRSDKLSNLFKCDQNTIDLIFSNEGELVSNSYDLTTLLYDLIF